jgi:hypothetical protein
MDSVAPLLDVTGCMVVADQTSSPSSKALANADTAMMALYLTSTPSEPPPIDPETLRPSSGFMDCEVRLNQQLVAHSLQAQVNALRRSLTQRNPQPLLP